MGKGSKTNNDVHVIASAETDKFTQIPITRKIPMPLTLLMVIPENVCRHNVDAVHGHLGQFLVPPVCIYP